MKVFFDGRIFGKQAVGGISRLAFELMQNLHKYPEVSQFFYHGLHVDRYPFEKKQFRGYWGLQAPDFMPLQALNFLNNVGVEYYYGRMEAGMMYHTFLYGVPSRPRGPVVVHCHDMIQELFGAGEKTIAFKKEAFEKADLIVAISQSTKNDLLKIYPSLLPEKVAVVPLGVSEVFFKPNMSTNLTARPYMLYVGPRNYSYKNFNLLLEVFIEKKYFLDFDLVLVGGEKELPVNEPWLRKVACGDQELANLYAGATAFVYPSLYEGFGIPPLEAMAAGCPVIASNTSSIPEVVGDAGLLFNPHSKESLQVALEKVAHSPQLRADLIERGKARARQFTWDAMANHMHEEYKKLTS